MMPKRLQSFITHYFLPHQSNNFKAKSLHISSIIFYIVLLILLQGANSILRRLEPNILGYATNVTVEKIVELVNQERIQNSLVPLNMSSELSTAATQKAADMFTKNYWAHISPTGVSPWQFISSSGYSYIYAGENLAKSFNNSEEVVRAWMNSPTHRANIMKPEYTDIGISVMNGILSGEETTLVVEEFGTPVKLAAVVKESDINTSQPVVQPVNNPRPSVNQDFETIAGTQTTQKTPEFLTKLQIEHLPKTISLIVAEIMLILLFIDSIYMWKHKTARISSRSLAHIIFLTSLLGAMGATGIGVIL